jgi:1-carboxybiuret hydrolase subunit AtzG-like
MQDDHANARQVSMASRRKKKATKAKAAARTKAVKPANKSAKSKSGRSKSTASKSKPQPKPDSLDDLIVAAAHALALTVDPAWKPAVRANLQVIFAQAALVTAFDLPDDAEPAPIFKA